MATIIFQTSAKNMIEASAKQKHLEVIAKLDADVLGKLAELAKNPSAIDKLKNNFSLIKSFL